jgi:hypothetical protein
MRCHPDDEHRKRGGNPVLFIVLVAIAVAAIRRQVALPKEERTWHGVVEVPVPYDFRFPTVERIRRSVWDPDDERVILPRAFGIGWSVNAAAVLKRLPGRAG